MEKVSLDSKTVGKAKMEVIAEVKEMMITKNENNSIEISFKILYGVTRYMKDWKIKVQNVRGCTGWIFGWKIIDLCDTVKNIIQGYLNQHLDNIQTIQAPKVLQKLQDNLNATNGNLAKITFQY